MVCQTNILLQPAIVFLLVPPLVGLFTLLSPQIASCPGNLAQRRPQHGGRVLRGVAVHGYLSPLGILLFYGVSYSTVGRVFVLNRALNVSVSGCV